MEIKAEAPVLWGLLDAVLSAGCVRTTTSAERGCVQGMGGRGI